MRWYLVISIAVLCVGIFCCHDAVGLSSQVKQRIEKGVEAGKIVVKAMKALKATEWVAKIGSVAGPMMTVASTAIQIAFLFVKIESAEMKLMKEQFAFINDRLNSFSIKFAEVKRRIEWSAIQVTFDEIEKDISILNTARVRLAKTESRSSMELQKENFIRKYEQTGTFLSEKLYAAMSRSSIRSGNLFESARKFTQNHLSLTFEFIKGTIQLLLQAYSVDIAYYELKYNSSELVEVKQKEFAENIKNVLANANKTEERFRNNWEGQLKTDVHYEVTLARGTSNKYFAKYLYEYLDYKYPSRQWFVLSYNFASDSRKHASVTCGGVKSVNVADRNVVVASIEKNAKTQFTKAWATAQFNKIPRFQLTEKYSAQVLNKLIPHNGKCTPAAVMAVVRGKDHRAYVADVQMYTGGKEWFMKTFCTYYCNTGLCWVKKEKCFNVIMWG